jgi:hypothetical protein
MKSKKLLENWLSSIIQIDDEVRKNFKKSMKPTKFSQMRKKDDNMMHSVNDDLLDDSDEDSEVLILEILEDLADFEIEVE